MSKLNIEGHLIGTTAKNVEYTNGGMSGVANAKAALDKLHERLANVEQNGGGSSPSGGKVGGNVPLFENQHFLNANGASQLAYNHNLFKYDGEGESVRITTKSNDNQVHPLAVLCKTETGGTDTVVKQVLFPLKDGTLRTYTLDIHVDKGYYILVSAWKTETPTYDYIEIIKERDGVSEDDILRNEAVCRARLETIGYIKAIMLDCGRKYFSVANIKAFIDYCKTNGLNTLELHFSENEGFRLELDNMTITVDGVDYDLSDALGDGITWQHGTPDGSGQWLDEDDMDEVIAYANTQGIRIVPSFDMPGHMGAILDTFTAFKLGDRDFNFLAPQGHDFLIALLDKYASYFAGKGCKFFNVCCDEISSSVQDFQQRMSDLMNEFADVIVKRGMIPMAFNDFFGRGTNICKGYVIDYWMHYEADNYVDSSVLEKLGYELVNSSRDIYYSNPWQNGRTFPSNFDVYTGNNFAKFKKPRGAMLCFWNDGNPSESAATSEHPNDPPDGGDALIARVGDYIAAYGVAMQKGMFAGEIRFVNGSPQWWNGTQWVGFPS